MIIKTSRYFLAITALIVGLMQTSHGVAQDAAMSGSGGPQVTDSLLAELSRLERSAWEAWKAKDSTFFTTRLVESARYVSGSGTSDRNQLARQTAGFKCSVGTIELDRLEALPLTSESALLIGRASYDYTCNANTAHAVSWFTTGFVRRDGQWAIAFHQETDTPK